jgi:serine protease
MRRFLSILLALGLVLSFSLVTSVPVHGADLYVPSVSYPTIQSALAVAGSGDTIHVAAGTYNEDITLVDGVSVLGAGADVTTIDGSGTAPVVTADSISSGTIFSGFTLTNGDASVGGGIYISDSSLTVTNCVITGNSADNDGGGMYILNDSSPVVTNCIFEGNTAGTFGGGICCWGFSASPILTNNTIIGNTSNGSSAWGEGGGGIYAESSSSPNIVNNIIYDNHAPSGEGGGILTANPTPTIDYNDVYGNTAAVGGTENYGGTAAAGANDISADPEFVDEGAGDYHLNPPGSPNPSPCIDVGDNSAPSLPSTDFEGNPRIFDGDDDGTDTVDMGADEYYVAPPPPPPPPPRGAVGGTVYPIDKAALLLPWLVLGVVMVLVAGGLILIRRQSYK